VSIGGAWINLFSNPEVEYLKTQHLARIATVSRKGQPDVVPVGFEFDGKHFWVGSHSQEIFNRTRKYLNVRNGNKLVALTIDDMESIDPWKPRAIKVYGTAEVMEHNGQFGPGKYLRITPRTSWAWGIKGVDVKEGDFRLKTVHD
jgi:pyridoxamine 5'-phosphate oxidase family protein